MDYPSKQLMSQLGDAVNESLSDSEIVAEVMARIKGTGFNVTLVVEASFAPDSSGLRKPRPMLAAGKEASPPGLRLTAKDQEFLRALKVAATE